jgi:Holliday junction resolvasome RuvABC endonuclease subunit
MKPSIFLGIDPGKSGSIAALFPNGDAVAHKMPETEADIWELISSFVTEDFTTIACIEQVHAVKGNGAVSMFTFGQGFGSLRMALTAAGIRWHLVTPQKWQKRLSCLSGGDKNKTKAAAQRLFPHIKCTHAISDGLLLAEYCRLELS